MFDKNALYKVLSNVVYIGKVRYKTEVHKGEHEPIVDPESFEKVQMLLNHNGRSGGRTVRNLHNALLSGILKCKACQCGMHHSYSKKRTKLYRYYVCDHAQKRGWGECPSPSLPAGEIERFVIDQIKCIGRDSTLVQRSLAQTRQHADSEIERLSTERAGLVRAVRDEYVLVGQIAGSAVDRDTRLAESQDRIRDAERRVTKIDDELAGLGDCVVDEVEVAAALGEFDKLWEVLSPKERARVVKLIVECVSYDGIESRLSITYRPTGLKTLTNEIVPRTVEAA